MQVRESLSTVKIKILKTNQGVYAFRICLGKLTQYFVHAEILRHDGSYIGSIMLETDSIKEAQAKYDSLGIRDI